MNVEFAKHHRIQVLRCPVCNSTKTICEHCGYENCYCTQCKHYENAVFDLGGVLKGFVF